MSTATLKIYVIVEGGIVQGVCTNDAALVGAEYTVIDYDADGHDPHDEGNMAHVRQPDGRTELAFIGGDYIGRLSVEILGGSR